MSALLRQMRDDAPLGLWLFDSSVGATRFPDYSGGVGHLDVNAGSGVASGASFLGAPAGLFDGSDAWRSATSGFQAVRCWETWLKWGAGTSLMTPFMVRGLAGVNADTVGGLLLNNAVSGRVQGFLIDSSAGSVIFTAATDGWGNDRWHHVVMNAQAQGAVGAATLHIDAVLVATSASFTRQAAAASALVSIGSNFTPNSQFYTGSVGPTAVYTAPLAADRIASHYAAALRRGVSY